MQKYQGDIGLIKLNESPKGLSFLPLQAEGKVIAEGEVTGHRHILTATIPQQVEIAQDERGFYLKVNEGEAILTHDKHDVQTMTPGIWFLPRQLERDIIREFRVVSD